MSGEKSIEERIREVASEASHRRNAFVDNKFYKQVEDYDLVLRAHCRR